MPISYSQRFEDLYLLRCFDGRKTGFYIDIGAGHPVFDNVSFAFYLDGWRGICAEPNPRLADLARAVRPRDHNIDALVGAAPGETNFYLVEDYHGLSTTIAGNAAAAQAQFGKSSRAMMRPVTTLAALCEAQQPAAIDFLKVDVEGAEKAVLAGNDWRRFRPKIVVVEALAPFTLQPAWDDYEPVLLDHGYRFAFFDGLNRYYAAAEEDGLYGMLRDGPETFAGADRFRDFGKAAQDRRHPDHGLALRLSGLDPIELPLLSDETLLEALTGPLPASDLDAPATPQAADAVAKALLGPLLREEAGGLACAGGSRLRDVYAAIVANPLFRIACGRISASAAW
ncbi:MAG: FkbM family methyltransferase [Pseudorhodoplanes sp.]